MGDPSNLAPILGPPAQPEPSAAPSGLAPFVQFHATQGSTPPADKYLTVNDQIEVAVVTSNAAALSFCTRILDPTGKIVIQSEGFTPVGARGLELFTFGVPEGFLLSADLEVGQLTSLPQRGQTWAKITIKRSLGGGKFFRLGLCQGYITLAGSISWPNPATDFGQIGPGNTIEQSPANPGAGADWSVTPPNGGVWYPQLVTAQLVTAVAVANRFPHLQIFDGTNPVWDSPPLAAQAASLTVRYVWALGDVSQAVTDGVTARPLPQTLRLGASFSIRSLTTALQAADQWQNIRLLLQEYNAPGG